MRLVAAAATDVGRVREGNEDAVLHDDRLGVFAVADGMGGHQAGEVASATAIEALRAAIAAGASVTDAVTQANAAVVDKARADSGMLGMGTTMTAAIEVVGGLRIGHVGDSRAYVLRDGILARVTDDHSLVEELVREGRITLEQAAVHPQRNVVTRALGIEDEVEVDDVAVELTGDDRVLLCSDGLSGMLRDADISAVLRRESDPEVCARALIAAANEAGGEDNITVLIIDVIGEEGDLPPAPLPAIGIGTTAVRAAAARDATTPRPTTDTAPTTGGPTRARRTSVARIAWAILPVVLVLGGTFLALNWYARSQYYVGFDGKQVAVYRGVPGGFLLWDPEVVWTSEVIERGDLDESQRLVVTREETFGSLDEARAVVDRLEDRVFPPTTSTTVGPSGATGVSGVSGPPGVSGARP
ncbi:MAG: Stp1/IreP family PP2C-type Ser/Thr phosphatase [Actinomycetes bacterium]